MMSDNAMKMQIDAPSGYARVVLGPQKGPVKEPFRFTMPDAKPPRVLQYDAAKYEELAEQNHQAAQEAAGRGAYDLAGIFADRAAMLFREAAKRL